LTSLFCLHRRTSLKLTVSLAVLWALEFADIYVDAVQESAIYLFQRQDVNCNAFPCGLEYRKIARFVLTVHIY
jgi:hypothetical protein